jgi:aryl-alcohol dehydrogenase-like predicted oxidoreductase
MHYRSFGKLGWSISEVGFGAWAIGGDMWGPQDDGLSLGALNRALDLGFNFFDTAQGYGQGHSEELLGRLPKEERKRIFIATKVPPIPGSTWPPPEDCSAADLFPSSHIIGECEKSLRRLGREYVDIYQFHTWASAFNIETGWFEAMMRLKEQGKIRAIGVSVPDTTPENVVGALALAKVDSVQVIYNIFEQSPRWNLFPICERLGIGVIVRVPFDEGALTGKLTASTVFQEGDVRRRYFRGRNLHAAVKRVEQIRSYKDEYHPSMPMPELALRFCLSHSAVSTVIPGIRTRAQAEMNAVASDGTHLSDDDLKKLEQFRWKKDFWHTEVDG